MMDSVRSSHIQAIARLKRQRSEHQRVESDNEVSKEVRMHIEKVLSHDSGKIDAVSERSSNDDSSSSLDHYTSTAESTPFESKDSARGSSAKIFADRKVNRYIDEAPSPPLKPPDSYSLSSINEESLPEDSVSQVCPQEIATNTILKHKIQKQKSNQHSRLPEIDKNLPEDSDEYDFCRENLTPGVAKFGSVDSLDTKSSMEPIPD